MAAAAKCGGAGVTSTGDELRWRSPAVLSVPWKDTSCDGTVGRVRGGENDMERRSKGAASASASMLDAATSIAERCFARVVSGRAPMFLPMPPTTVCEVMAVAATPVLA